jgi:hypothetical protein
LFKEHFCVSYTRTAKTVARILRRRIERKTDDVLGEDYFAFRRGKETIDAIGMFRTISEPTLVIVEKLCASFIDWQKAFDHVSWTKLMQILKGTGIDWCKRRLISKFTCIRVLKYDWTKRRREV